MTISKRVAERKVAKFENNITRRGNESKKKFNQALILFGLFVFVTVGSWLYRMIKMALNDGVA